MRGFGFLGKLLLTAVLVWSVTFLLVRALTTDPAAALSGLNSDPSTRQYLATEMGLDRPVAHALGESLWRVATLQFGHSLRTHRPVVEDIAAPLGLTGLLALAVAALCTLVAAAGFALGLTRGSGASRAASAGTAALAAVPGFLLALLLAPAFPAPPPGASVLAPRYLLLPLLALLLPLLPYALHTGLRFARDLRALPWFEAYCAFGFSHGQIALTRGRRWLLRGAANTGITTFLAAFTGSVAVEIVCGLPGLGTLVLDAIDARDLPVILVACGLTGALASVLVLVRGELERAR